MARLGGMLRDQEVAEVLTYVRKSFGNDASDIPPVKVKELRSLVEKNSMIYNPSSLLKEYPMEK